MRLTGTGGSDLGASIVADSLAAVWRKRFHAINSDYRLSWQWEDPWMRRFRSPPSVLRNPTLFYFEIRMIPKHAGGAGGVGGSREQAKRITGARFKALALPDGPSKRSDTKR
jgi:hypothetical protein